MRHVHAGAGGGLTAVEVLIIMVVLGLLAAIAVPNYRSRATRCKEAAVVANAYTVQEVVEDWAVCNAGAYPDREQIKAELFPGRVFPANPFNGDPCVVGAPGFRRGELAYTMSAGTYVIEGYGARALLILLTNRAVRDPESPDPADPQGRADGAPGLPAGASGIPASARGAPAPDRGQD